MKKRALLIVISLCLVACKKEEFVPRPIPTSSFLPLINNSPAPQVEVPPIEDESLELGIDKEVDLDLAPFGMNAAYAEVMNILRERDKYIGKKVRLLGHYTFFTNEQGEKIPIVMIVDTLACCAQGLEFRLEKGIFPEDYPENGKRILLWGVIRLKTAYNGYDYPYVLAERYELR